MDELSIIETDLESVLQMRMAHSDPPRSREAALSIGDSAPECVHFGACLRGELVGVCSVGPEHLPILGHPPGWRLRGLVVLPQFRGSGLGTELIRHRLGYVEKLPHPRAWGYAKRRLVRFYSSFGYRPTGYTHMHPVGGETLLFGNAHTLRFIEDATGVSYAADELPVLGAIVHDPVRTTGVIEGMS
jgi:GNAT superfamily N-acetyltransferase